MPVLRTRVLSTPLEPLTAISLDADPLRAPAGAVLVCLEFGHRVSGAQGELSRLLETPDPPDEVAPGVCPVLDAAEAQLGEYFAGARRAFEVPMLTLGTEFQRRVWGELGRIPFGATISYGRLAERVGSPGGARAAGGANGANRIAILIPCHRVIDADGALHGYGGGLAHKRRLLEIEGALHPAPLFEATDR
ncbi:MAG: methylated-DNA--[protein]-cysteine S-methyltransferase [Phycisphaerales bacterium]|nr:MAG: methylated-DNA--[protein]-cysteine S-methyltransferase [Phycisphaerales bacterium]